MSPILIDYLLTMWREIKSLFGKKYSNFREGGIGRPSSPARPASITLPTQTVGGPEQSWRKQHYPGRPYSISNRSIGEDFTKYGTTPSKTDSCLWIVKRTSKGGGDDNREKSQRKNVSNNKDTYRLTNLISLGQSLCSLPHFSSRFLSRSESRLIAFSIWTSYLLIYEPFG
ncbi:hypothetical protein CPB86DRAFT_802215 [Serendipita vermifera]|nr:hypothetical protein CPB86DRAFT_802215 [Serendipita vermifera]